jgi:hypothetical protein
MLLQRSTKTQTTIFSMKSVAGGRKTWRHARADGNLETLVEQEDEAKTNALATDTRSPIEPKCPAMMADVR